MNVVVTGSQGFIGGYLVQELLDAGYTVTGIDDFSKYGKIIKAHDRHPNFTLVERDLKSNLFDDILTDADYLIAGAAKIGGISYFHRLPYDLLASNERIIANTCDSAIRVRSKGRLRKVVYISSSMVFENSVTFPSREGDELKSVPPISSYGFQKLAVEYFARAAWDQYQLPFTIVRPFNCIGIGEARAKVDAYVKSGNIELAMSHVVPDLIQKIAKGQTPLRILGTGSQIRHYTYGGDLARGIRLALESELALNTDFNISTNASHSVKELANVIFNKMKGNSEVLAIELDEAFPHDVQKRIPSTEKAERLLGFKAETSLDKALDEIIPWVINAVDVGLI